MEPMETKLLELKGELKGYFEKAAAEQARFGTVLGETQTTMKNLQTQVDAIDAKLVERHASGGGEKKTFEQRLREDESVKRLMHDRSGNAVIDISAEDAAKMFESKTTITSVGQGYATTGVMPIGRIEGIVPEARQTLTVRDMLTARPTTQAIVDFVKVTTPMTRTSSPQTETAVKFEQTMVLTAASERVKTLAAWIPASKQILDDFTELAGFIQTSLPFYVDLEEEIQLLSGDGTGENLHGFNVQATAFLTTLLSSSAGWNKIDMIGRAIQQITAAKELQPTFAVVHPNDWWGMRLQKDSYGRYILGDPQTIAKPSLFGLDVVPTTSMTSGYFLVGSGNPVASEIRDRMGMQVEISTNHSDYFTRNLVAIRAEKRSALVVKRPASYIYGAFTNSPA